MGPLAAEPQAKHPLGFHHSTGRDHRCRLLQRVAVIRKRPQRRQDVLRLSCWLSRRRAYPAVPAVCHRPARKPVASALEIAASGLWTLSSSLDTAGSPAPQPPRAQIEHRPVNPADEIIADPSHPRTSTEFDVLRRRLMEATFDRGDDWDAEPAHGDDESK